MASTTSGNIFGKPENVGIDVTFASSMPDGTTDDETATNKIIWSEYSLKGRNGENIAFQYLVICRVFIKACLKNNGNAKEIEIEVAISETFTYASNQCGGINYKVISTNSIGQVEDNPDAVYMGLLEGQDKIYSKKPLGKFETGNFKFQLAEDLETTLNMKDIKKIYLFDY